MGSKVYFAKRSLADQKRIQTTPALAAVLFSGYGTNLGKSFLHCCEMIGYSHFLPWNALNIPRSQSTKQNTDQSQPSSNPKIPRWTTERITVRILIATETTKAVHPKKILSTAQCRAKESFFSIK